MIAATFEDVLSMAGVSLPDETLAELEVPVLSGAQRQGDVLVVPRKKLTAGERKTAVPIPLKGVQVVRGEATGNTHELHGAGLWLAKTADLLLGVVEVPEGEVAYLIHTDEHGANGLAPGCYELHGKREQAEQIRRVQD